MRKLPVHDAAKALAFPLRVRILQLLDGHVRSPNDLAGELGAPLSNVAYHVRTLADLGALKLVRTAQRRGATEHYYTATVRITISQEAIRTGPR